MTSLYEAAGGGPAMLALAHAWHEQCLADPVVSHAFSHPGQHPQHTERLAAYWGEALGGPASYTETMGDESRVVRMHSGNGDHEEMDRRALGCFARALVNAGLPEDLHPPLQEWFTWNTGRLSARPQSADGVPSDLTLPVWPWPGDWSG